jgi:ADP-heptose:LPS heptosyltransferase
VMIDLGARVEDFAETAACIEVLDLVIMTDSSVAHLSGSLGRPVWNLLNYAAYWLYLWNREDTPWYPSMRLIRQPKAGDWDSVFARVREELKRAAERKRRGEHPFGH